MSLAETDSFRGVPLYDKIVMLGLGLGALGLYLLTLAPTVLEADAGEFQFVPWLPGIAHPTGYPLYILLGWLWSHLLPVGEVAWRMNLLSAVFAALAVSLIYRLGRSLLDRVVPEAAPPARLLGAALGAATFAVTATFWSQALVAEVYTLHTLLVAAILWLALKSAYEPGRWSTIELAFVFGLGLAHHRTTLLLVPALLFFFWANRATFQPYLSGRFWLVHLAWLLAPLLLYLYLPLIAPVTPYATLSLSEGQSLVLYENSLSGFWQHITGAVFTGEVRPEALGFDRLILTWQLLRQQVGWVGVLLALLGLRVLWQRRHFDLLALTGLAFVSIVGFNLIYFIGDVFVLFIPAWLVLCLWLALGTLVLAHEGGKRLVARKMGANEDIVFEGLRQRLRWNLYHLVVYLVSLFFFVIPLVLLLTRYPLVDQSHNLAAQTWWREILASPIPPSAILLSNDRNEIMPLWYYQYVERQRPDLLGLFPLVVPDPAYENIGRLLDQALASGRPVYLVKPMAGLALKAEITPENNLFRVTLPDLSPIYPAEVTFTGGDEVDQLRLSGYDLSSASVMAGDEITVTLYWQVAEPLTLNYTSYVHLVGPEGQTIAQSDHLPGEAYYPSRYWQAGETLRDRHTLTIPAETQAALYQLQVGLYHQPEPGLIQNLGQSAQVGVVAVKDPQTMVVLPPGELPEVDPVNFGDAIRLLGYDLVPVDRHRVLLNLTWQARQLSTVNWTVFVHLLDQEDNLVAQQDSQPQGGAYPTTVWQIEEVVTDPHLLTLPDGLPAGEYQLALGLYHPVTGERLLITDHRGELLGDSLKVKITL